LSHHPGKGRDRVLAAIDPSKKHKKRPKKSRTIHVKQPSETFERQLFERLVETEVLHAALDRKEAALAEAQRLAREMKQQLSAQDEAASMIMLAATP
jgi:molecular chaperone DnaK (HSP70)